MINTKNLRKIYISSVIVILLGLISSITFFLKNSDGKNYTAIIDLKFARSIDHIFMDSDSTRFINDFTALSFETMLPKYNWDVSGDNNIEVKLFAYDKKTFYTKTLPQLRSEIKKEIPNLNKIIMEGFQKTYKGGVTQEILKKDKSGKELFYYSMSKQPYYAGSFKSKVRFRKLQLTQFEFVAVSLFVTVSLLTLVSSYYISKKRKK